MAGLSFVTSPLRHLTGLSGRILAGMTTGGTDFEARSKEVGIDRAAWDLYEAQEDERDAAVAKLLAKD